MRLNFSATDGFVAPEHPYLCSFGVTEIVAAGLIAEGVGATAATIGATALVGAGVGAASGGLIAGIEGENVGQGVLHGAEFGALTGGLGGAGGALGSDLGGLAGSAGIGEALGGVAGGILGGEAATGGKLKGIGFAEAGLGGYLAGQSEGAVADKIASGGVAPPGGGPSAAGLSGGNAGDTLAGVGGAGAEPGVTVQDLTSGQVLQSVGGGAGPGQVGNYSVFGATPAGPSADTTFNFGSAGAPSVAASAGGPPAPPVGTASAVAPDTSTSLLGKLGGAVSDSVAKNPVGALAAVGGLGYDVLGGQQKAAGEKQLAGLASQEAAQGAALSGYVTSGKLPPGLQQVVDEQTQAAVASIRQKYAQLGASGGTAEQQEIAAAQQRAISTAAQIGSNLLQSGMSATNTSGTLFADLARINQGQTASTGDAIARLAAALSPTAKAA